MVSSNLPIELTDRIIDFCHNDKNTLSNYALTHSSWLAASHFHLFHTITTGQTERSGSNLSFTKVLSCFRAGKSSILPYIRTAKIESFRGVGGTLGLRNSINLAHTIRRSCCLEYLPAPSMHLSLTKSLLFLPTSAAISLVSDIVTHP